MSSITESIISWHSSSIPVSSRSERKEKFDSILKVVSKKNNSNSQENLVDNIELSSVTSNKNLDDYVEESKISKNEDEEEKESKKIILNKFLSDSNSLRACNSDDNTVISMIKPPVPKPRKKLEAARRDSLTSIGTFDVTSPKICLSPTNKDSGIIPQAGLNTDSGTSAMVKPKPRKKWLKEDKWDYLTGIGTHGDITSSKKGSSIDNERVDIYQKDVLKLGSGTSVKIKPKPRKKKLEEGRRDSLTSAGTFDVTSPEVLLSPKNLIACENNQQLAKTDSLTSVRTFEVISPKMQYNKYSDSDTEINNDKNIEVVGDLVLHDRMVSKIDICSNHNEVLEKADNEILIDRHSSSSSKNRLITKHENDDSELKIGDLQSESKEKIDKPKPKKRYRKKKADDSENEVRDNNKQKRQDAYDYQHITEIKIHKTDKLLLNSFVIHPVVKIHIVDVRTGKYFKKSDKRRPVVFYYENDSNDYILPVMSAYYNLQEKRSFYPMWEETILLNEDFQYIINENVIIFFEILDFATMNFATLIKNKDCDKGWYKIAFAFLKVVGKNNAKNVDKKVRLQLYYPQQTNPKKLEHNMCPLWDWWLSNKLKKYPSTLYITIKKVVSPVKVIETFRSKTPLQKEEIGNPVIPQLNNDSVNADRVKQDADNFKLKWQKILDKKEKLPEKCALQIDTFEEGCFVLKFSNNGLYLACSIKINDNFEIVVYLVKSFEEIFRFKSHQALVYSISWSKDDTYLLTASSDNTVVIWNFEDKSCFQILPHPSFVYTSGINLEGIIATGCYDKILRIWSIRKENNKYELHQELEEHKGFVTSLCFSSTNCSLLYSADSCGKIVEWNQRDGEWSLKRRFDILDLRVIKINQIMLFPNDKRILVHSRDSALRIISIANECVVHWLHGALNTRVQTFCDISSMMSSYVASGSENGLVIVWDAKTGEHVKTYEGFSNKSKIAHCVQFHPKLNILAMSHYGSNEPILIYYDKDNDVEEDIDQNCEAKVKFQQENQSDLGKQQEKFDFRKVLQKMDQLLA